jgi:hypothetical protein
LSERGQERSNRYETTRIQVGVAGFRYTYRVPPQRKDALVAVLADFNARQREAYADFAESLEQSPSERVQRTCQRGHTYSTEGAPVWLGGRCPKCRRATKARWEVKSGRDWKPHRQCWRIDYAIKCRLRAAGIDPLGTVEKGTLKDVVLEAEQPALADAGLMFGPRTS